MATLDLGPAARELGELVRDVPDDRLGAPTPCPDYSLGDLLEHVGGLAQAFAAAAAKELGGATGQPPAGDASRLAPDWRTSIPRDLAAMAAAWQDPSAWTGTTQAGGVELSGEEAGMVALDEIVVHGWDVARATGRPFAVDDASLAAVHAFVSSFPPDGPERAGLFGPAVAVPDGAPLLDRVIGMTGRDPAWSPG